MSAVGDPAGGEQARAGGEGRRGDDGGVQGEGVGEDAGDLVRALGAF